MGTRVGVCVSVSVGGGVGARTDVGAGVGAEENQPPWQATAATSVRKTTADPFKRVFSILLLRLIWPFGLARLSPCASSLSVVCVATAIVTLPVSSFTAKPTKGKL